MKLHLQVGLCHAEYHMAMSISVLINAGWDLPDSPVATLHLPMQG